MSQRVLSPQQFVNDMPFYHGTDRNVQNDTIEPGHPRQFDSPAPGGEESYASGAYAYATTDRAQAEQHQGDADYYRHPVVHEVEPANGSIPVRDPEDKGEQPTSFMNRQGWHIRGR